MTIMKYQPYGLKDEDLTEPHTKVMPERVQKLIDLHHKNKVEYVWSEEDRNEQIFDYRKGLRPTTYTYDLEAIYRVRDPYDKKNEYYFYQKKGRVLNDSDDPEYSNSLTYGFAIEPVHELRWNHKTKRKEPYKLRDDPVYFLKWDRKEVIKLLDGSTSPCSNLYIGVAALKGYGNTSPAQDMKAIKNRDDFLNGSMDDLVLLNKAGMMTPEISTVNMIDKARSKFEEEALKRIASVASPQPQPQQSK
jgi:hypothetical protein